MRHYTSREGLKGIRKDGYIKANDNNNVYLELARKKPLSQTAVRDKYHIADNKGRDYVETDVPEELLKWVKNPRYHRLELTVKGNVKLSDPSFIERK